MTVRCVDCKHWNLRDVPAMAAVGMGRCKVDSSSTPKARFFSAGCQRECSKFQAAEPAAVQSRTLWLKQKLGR